MKKISCLPVLLRCIYCAKRRVRLFRKSCFEVSMKLILPKIFGFSHYFEVFQDYSNWVYSSQTFGICLSSIQEHLRKYLCSITVVWALGEKSWLQRPAARQARSNKEFECPRLQFVTNKRTLSPPAHKDKDKK